LFSETWKISEEVWKLVISWGEKWIWKLNSSERRVHRKVYLDGRKCKGKSSQWWR